MDDIEFVYTVGMDETDLVQRLTESVSGVLSLADGSTAYGVPVSYHYDEAKSRFLIRLTDDGESSKLRFLGETEEASFLVHEVEDDEGHSWSVVVRGPIRRLPDEAFTATEINELFDPLRVFDEDVSDLVVRVVELTPTAVTGRTTATGQ